ncbi:transcriptional regulator [Actinomadura sp. NAK00032]|uniref:transcriptional regulator n=1 Tax=Actinomadura sp. NAK00032 TaxID=2742128 RepID=UPI00159141A1|nr:transcriptional regulator [Actinomadura sp. NAK00032]QKW35716.1 transcriptional regulator [Actinomadura sp. NAK00032]
MTDHGAAELVAGTRAELAAAARANRFVDMLETGEMPRERLIWLAGEEYRIVGSDRRSFALLAARFPDSSSGELFLGLAQGEAQALGLLRQFAAELGQSEKNLMAYEPKPWAQAYPAFLAQKAAFGTASEVALAMLANLEEWGSYCARTARALQTQYGFAEDAVGFFDFFAESPPGFEEQALDVIASGLAAGDDPVEAARAARLLHAYETAFWDVLAQDLP